MMARSVLLLIALLCGTLLVCAQEETSSTDVGADSLGQETSEAPYEPRGSSGIPSHPGDRARLRRQRRKKKSWAQLFGLATEGNDGEGSEERGSAAHLLPLLIPTREARAREAPTKRAHHLPCAYSQAQGLAEAISRRRSSRRRRHRNHRSRGRAQHLSEVARVAPREE